MSFNRTLINPKNQKTWSIRIDGNEVIAQSGKRVSAKEFPSREAAEKDYSKKVWAKFKSGFIHQDESPDPQKPSLQFYFNEKYSGFYAMDLAPSGNLLALSKPPVKSGNGEFWTVQLNPFVINRPTPAPRFDYYGLQFLDDEEQLLVHDDRVISLRNLNSGVSKTLAKGNYKGEVTAHCANMVLIAQDKDDFMVMDLRTEAELLRIPMSLAGIDNASSTSCGISPDGKLIAVSREPGKVEVWDIAAKEVRISLDMETDTVSKFKFHPNGQHLLLLDQNISLKIYDLETGNVLPLPYKVEFSYPSGEKFPVEGFGSFALSPTGKQIAAINTYRGVREIAFFDYESGAYLASIFPEYLLKGCKVSFSRDGKQLVIRTDYGLVAVYPLQF